MFLNLEEKIVTVSQLCKDHNSSFLFNFKWYMHRANRARTMILQGLLTMVSISFLSHLMYNHVYFVGKKAPIYLASKHSIRLLYHFATRNIISRFSLPVSNNSIPFCVNLEKDFLLFLAITFFYHLLEMVYYNVWGNAPILCDRNIYSLCWCY